MSFDRCSIFIGLVLASLTTGCSHPKSGSGVSAARVIQLTPGPNIQKEAQKALIDARPGDTIEFGEGTFDFTMGLSLAVENVTIRGQGMEKSILSFKNQDAGKEGLLVTRGEFVIEDLTVQDTKGDAIKVNEADGVTFRRVRAQWTGGEKETNGAYGLYPVQCKNVLIEECAAFGAADGGIYVGQSENVIVRKCRVERNVAGIEIENSIDADVYENTAGNNASALLVFDLPGLTPKNGKRVRVFNNQIIANNHANFAPKGNIIASVEPGTGILVMASHQVELFQNVIKDNELYSLLIISFDFTERPIEDKEYDPIPQAVYVHDNWITGGGKNPHGELAQALVLILGKPLPDMIYDGVQDPARLVNGKPAAGQGIYFKNNGRATFANLHWQKPNPKDVAGSLGKITRDLKSFEGELPPLPAVELSGAH